MPPFKTRGKDHFQMLPVRRNNIKNAGCICVKTSLWGVGHKLSIIPTTSRARDQGQKCTLGQGMHPRTRPVGLSHSHAEQLPSLHPSPRQPTSSPAFTSTPRESEQWDHNHSSQGVCWGSGPVCFSLEVTRSPRGAGKVERVSHIFPFVRVLITSII